MDDEQAHELALRDNEIREYQHQIYHMTRLLEAKQAKRMNLFGSTRKSSIALPRGTSLDSVSDQVRLVGVERPSSRQGAQSR